MVRPVILGARRVREMGFMLTALLTSRIGGRSCNDACAGAADHRLIGLLKIRLREHVNHVDTTSRPLKHHAKIPDP